jgi:hypothetical protein
LVGILGINAVSNVTANNFVSGWSTNIGRFIQTMLDIGVIPFMVFFSIILFIGLALLFIELLNKNEKF